MKKITKILIPAATIAASTMTIMPLITSCAKGGIQYEDVSKGYTPSIEKHSKDTLTLKQAYSEYAQAFKKDPKILSEDYKYFGSQLIEYLDAYFNNPESTNEEKAFSVEKMNVGLGNFSIDENDKISYSVGIDTKFSVKKDLGDIGNINFDVDLNLTSDFKKFSGFELQNHSSKYVDNWILVQPIWPADLKQEDWSYSIGIKGSVQLSIDGEKALDLGGINTNLKFDSKNALLLEMEIGSSGATMLDTFQRLGAFTSYYLSDVTCQDHVVFNTSYIELYHNPAWGWESTVLAALDESDYDNEKMYFEFDQDYINLDSCEISSKTATVKLSIGDYYLQNYLDDYDNYIRMYINYSNSQPGTKPGLFDTYLWSEKHSLKPRFHLETTTATTDLFEYAKYDGQFSFDKKFDSEFKPGTFTLIGSDGSNRYFAVNEILNIKSDGTVKVLPLNKYTVTDNRVTFNDVTFEANSSVEIHFTYKGILNSDIKGNLTHI